MHRIDYSSRTPPHHQIAAWLREAIRRGEYTPDGPSLPSMTRLSQEWGVARRTAGKALRMLRDEGLIETEPGMGYWVRR